MLQKFTQVQNSFPQQRITQLPEARGGKLRKSTLETALIHPSKKQQEANGIM